MAGQYVWMITRNMRGARCCRPILDFSVMEQMPSIRCVATNSPTSSKHPLYYLKFIDILVYILTCSLRLLIKPKILVNVEKVDTSVNLLGRTISSPICVAPTSGHALAHHDGEKATARGKKNKNDAKLKGCFKPSFSENIYTIWELHM